MATTTPDNISYPNNTSVKKTIEGHLEDTAASVQTALNSKAASSHSHAASDITSGTLGVARGGTGVESFTSGTYLKGAGTSAISTQTGIPRADLPSGTILQVNTITISSAATYSMGSGAIQNVGLNIAITPTRTSSRILIISTVSSAGISFNRPGTALLRDGSRIAVGDAAGSRNRTSSGGASGETAPSTQSVHYVDSPNTTSSVTYSVYIVNYHSGTQSYAFNYDQGNSDNPAHGRTASSITVMEIA
jgi:hypothetical protein